MPLISNESDKRPWNGKSYRYAWKTGQVGCTISPFARAAHSEIKKWNSCGVLNDMVLPHQNLLVIIIFYVPVCWHSSSGSSVGLRLSADMSFFIKCNVSISLQCTAWCSESHHLSHPFADHIFATVRRHLRSLLPWETFSRFSSLLLHGSWTSSSTSVSLTRSASSRCVCCWCISSLSSFRLHCLHRRCR